jgi:hypothetical protein
MLHENQHLDRIAACRQPRNTALILRSRPLGRVSKDDRKRLWRILRDAAEMRGSSGCRLDAWLQAEMTLKTAT